MWKMRPRCRRRCSPQSSVLSPQVEPSALSVRALNFSAPPAMSPQLLALTLLALDLQVLAVGFGNHVTDADGAAHEYLSAQSTAMAQRRNYFLGGYFFQVRTWLAQLESTQAHLANAKFPPHQMIQCYPAGEHVAA